MKKLALATAFAVLSLASTAAFANNTVTVGTGLTASAGPVTGNWASAGNTPATNTFTIANINSLIMIVTISSQLVDPILRPYSNFVITCNGAPTTVIAGSSFICRTNTNVTILSQANALNKAAVGTYSLIFEKSGCTTNCNNNL